MQEPTKSRIKQISTGTKPKETKRSVILHVIPVKRLAGHLSARIELPPEHQIRPLQQVACNLDMADICGVVLGVDVVVAEDSVGVEEVDEAPLAVFEVFENARDFFFVDGCLGVFGAFLIPDAPLGL